MAQSDGTPRAAVPGVDWVRLADGVFLAGLGVFAYLSATDRLPWTFWFDVLSMWPILLITAGLRIAVGQTRQAWMIVFGPLLVLAVLAGMASGRLDRAAPGPWQSFSEAHGTEATRVVLAGALHSSRVELVAQSLPEGVALQGRRGSREDRARVERKPDPKTDRITLVNGDYGLATILPGRMSRWELAATDAVPVGVRLEGAVIGSKIDLTRGALADATFAGVFLGSEMRLPRPKAPVKVTVKGVFNVVELVVPPGTPVRVHGPGLPANVVDRGNGADPFDPANPGYEVRIEGIFSRLGVTTAAQ
jgi:hypothetical protein